MSSRFERTADKKQVEKHQKVLLNLLSKPENKICADCKGRDPRWASSNLGVFVCLRCSGVHRSLGTHITKVRSVDLDTWTPEQIEVMLRWGNERANKYWEFGLPPNHIPDEANVSSFIRSKYEYKKFCKPGPMPVPETLDGPEAASAASSQNQSQPQAFGDFSAPQKQATAVQQPQQMFGDFSAPIAPVQQQQQQQKPPQNNNFSDILGLYNAAPQPIVQQNNVWQQPQQQQFAAFPSGQNYQAPNNTLQSPQMFVMNQTRPNVAPSNFVAQQPLQQGMQIRSPPYQQYQQQQPQMGNNQFANWNQAAVQKPAATQPAFADFGAFQSAPNSK